MRGNMFMGDGPFGSRHGSVPAQPMLGQWANSGYRMRPSIPASGFRANRWTAAHRPLAPRTAITPVSDSEVGCYFCAGLEGAPTYWMSGTQARQWNEMRNAQCAKVPQKECQQKYGQMREQMMTRMQRTSFNAFTVPSSASLAPATMVAPSSYGSMMVGIRVENPEFVG